MECILCGSSRVTARPTVMSGFLADRITPGGVNVKHSINLCHCNECSFSFYDRRLTDEESALLYDGYRGEEYQKCREKYDCWYTPKINDALNHDVTALKEQKRVINKIIKEQVRTEIKVALDYGGNRGETFTELTGTEEKYVYDISGAQTVPGVEGIREYGELSGHSFDLIMCNMTLEHVSCPRDFIRLLYGIGSEHTYYYLEVPSENPFEKDKFSARKNIGLLLNPYYSNIRLIRHYIRLRGQPYMPMSEHVNFFTPESLGNLMSSMGFHVMDVQENIERGVLGKNKVLSVICRKK